VYCNNLYSYVITGDEHKHLTARLAIACCVAFTVKGGAWLGRLAGVLRGCAPVPAVQPLCATGARPGRCLRAQVGGIKHCLGVDALNTRSNTLTRFVAPVTLLATGGAGQARARGVLAPAPARMGDCWSEMLCSGRLPCSARSGRWGEARVASEPMAPGPG